MRSREIGESERYDSLCTSFLIASISSWCVLSNQIKSIQSLHNVTWDPSMEPALRALETNIINAVLPVRDKLHKQWKRRSPLESVLGSGASSVSSNSVSSSSKTSKEGAVLDTPSSSAAPGTSLAGATTNLTAKPSKAKNKKGIHLI